MISETFLNETSSQKDLLLNYISRRHLDKSYIQKNCKETQGGFLIPLRNFDGQWWRQRRILNPTDNDKKSKTEYGSTWRYFLNWRDRDKDEILIVEWEIDFLSIIPYATQYNLIWLKWINNLSTCIRDIEKLQKVYDVYILVDNDFAAEEAITKIPYTPLHLFDVREALSWCKDVNDAICSDCLNLSILPKRIVKLKPQPKKRRSRSDSYDTIDKINAIPVIDVLESLYPQFKRRGIESISEDGKETHWYKYSRRLNIVRDFSGKGRPEWWPYQIAKSKFWDAKLTFLYFKGKI